LESKSHYSNTAYGEASPPNPLMIGVWLPHLFPASILTHKVFTAKIQAGKKIVVYSNFSMGGGVIL
jgi:hypothetical protein